MRRTSAAFALAAILAGCQQSPGPDPAPGPVPAPVPASLRAADEAGNQGPLTLGTLQRIALDASFTASPGSHSVRIDVFGPGGGLYGSLRGQAMAGADGVATLRRWLEVSGTSIEQYNMAGTWQFALAVDDGPPLASTAIDVTD
jgi:hypothetical protein